MVSQNVSDFMKLTILWWHPLHAAIGQVCGGECVSKLSFFILHTTHFCHRASVFKPCVERLSKGVCCFGFDSRVKSSQEIRGEMGDPGSPPGLESVMLRLHNQSPKPRGHLDTQIWSLHCFRFLVRLLPGPAGKETLNCVPLNDSKGSEDKSAL